MMINKLILEAYKEAFKKIREKGRVPGAAMKRYLRLRREYTK